MKKLALLSLLVALVFISPALAQVTLNPDTISLDITEGSSEQIVLGLTTDENITNIRIEITADLQRALGNEVLQTSAVTINPASAAAWTAADPALLVQVTVTVPNGQVAGEYTGEIEVNYDTVATQDLQALVPVTVNVIGSSEAIVSLPDVNFGDDNQRRDIEISEAFTIQNTGNVDLTGINLSSTLTDYHVGFTGVPTTLAVGSSATVTMFMTIPLDKNAGIEVFENKLRFDSTEVSATSDVSVNAENYLSIEDIFVRVIHSNGDEEDEDGLDDGDEVDEKVRPGDDIEIEIEVENDNKDKIDFDDVEVKISNDNELWDNDDKDKQDIDEGDTEVFKFDFSVDNKADDGTDGLVIEVEGTDKEGALHTIRWVIDFDIEEPDEEVTINSIDISPSVIRCGSDIRIEVEFENTGKDDLDDAQLRLEIEQLDFVDFERGINIDENDEEIIIFNVNIPSNAVQGSYFVDITAFFDRGSNDDSDFDSEQFTVQSCSGSTDNDLPRDDLDTDNDGDSGIDVNPSGDDTITVTTPTGGVVTSVGKPSFFESSGYLVLLTGLIIILIVVVLMVLLTGKKK